MSKSIEPVEHGFRTDIQALRGIAVLSVVLFHTGVGLMKGGYLGVDIFFVISGFLITALIARAVTEQRFSFTQFYVRRAKRLLPAAYVVFLVVAVLSAKVLTSIEFEAFKSQLYGSLLFAANIALWSQSGYFDGGATMKPLLHIWSLAIEEQYYMVLPAILFVLPRRWWLGVVVAMAAASLAACVYLMQTQPTAAFYLLPTRAWELLIGSAGALVTLAPMARKVLAVMAWPALATVFLLPMFPIGGAHPGIDAGVVCIATLVVLLARVPLFERNPISRGLAFVGDFSYSLYLVHWPVFAFLNNAWVGEIPASARIEAAALALVLGYGLYAFIERPVRKVEFKLWDWRLPAAASVLGAALAGSLLIGSAAEAGTDYAQLRRPNYGLSQACEFTEDFSPGEECANAPDPQVLVWGDSYAMHIVPGLAKQNVKLAQATMSVCGPILDLAPSDTTSESDYNRAWAEKCIAFNDSVLDYVSKTPSIVVVVLASRWGQYLPATGWQVLGRKEVGLVPIEASVETAAWTLGETIAAIRKLGKRVVLMGPPPSGDFNTGDCLERLSSGKLALGPFADCRIPRQMYEDDNSGIIAMLNQTAADSHTDVIWPESVLCSTKFCKTMIEGTALYRDDGHLSYLGSELLARLLNTAQQIEASAR